MMNVNWQFYPKSKRIPQHLTDVIEAFNKSAELIKTPKEGQHSDAVLKIIAKDLTKIGFQVEKSKLREDKIQVPVLFGPNGRIEKSFDADAYNEINKTVLEVEAGRGVTNYQFLKDLFQASVMYEVEYLVTAVCNTYLKNKDFETVKNFYDSLYASNRLLLPFKGVLIIGY